MKIIYACILALAVGCVLCIIDDKPYICRDRFPIGTVVKIDGKSCIVRTHAVFSDGIYWVKLISSDSSKEFSWPQNKLEAAEIY